MCSVLFVFAEMFNELGIRKQLEMHGRRLPGLRISLRVIDRDVHFQRSEIRAAEAFSDVQRIRRPNFGTLEMDVAIDDSNQAGLGSFGRERPSVKICRY